MTNAVFLSDNQGIPLAMFEPQAGNHADLYEIDEMIDEIVGQLLDAYIVVDGLSATLTQALTKRNSDAHSSSTASFPMYVPIQETEVNRRRIGCTTRRCIRRDGKPSGQTHGWMVSKQFLTDSTQPYPAGRDGTSSHLSLFSLKIHK